MKAELLLWVVAGAAVISTVSSCTVDIILTSKVPDQDDLRALRALLFSAFSLQIVALGCICYYCVTFIRKSASRPPAWIDTGVGAGFNAVALAVTGVALIWLRIKLNHVPASVTGLRDVGLVLWGLMVILHLTFFVLLSIHTRQMLRKALSSKQSANFGITLPRADEVAIGLRPSFCSRDTTLASPRPQTSTSSRTFSLRSTTTKVGSSVRSKFTKSQRSSLDLPPFPAGEATALGNAFDRYDTSSINHDMRTTILSSSPAPAKSGLEPIPGSRPGSPEDEPTLPTSPKLRQYPQSARAVPTTNPLELQSSPPSSPPNFSRPTSRGQAQAAMSPTQLRQPRISASMNDLIHPLFRPDSPDQPRIMTSNTMVTASPLANEPITPKTLKRLRSTSDVRAKKPTQDYDASTDLPAGSLTMTKNGQWRVMPPLDDSPIRPRSRSHSSIPATNRRPSTAGSDSAESIRLAKTSSIGSPGPSIVEEDELPPILPGFVLSAGSRSSLVGYGKRKTVKRASAVLG